MLGSYPYEDPFEKSFISFILSEQDKDHFILNVRFRRYVMSAMM